jgi:hypothetical protein
MESGKLSPGYLTAIHGRRLTYRELVKDRREKTNHGFSRTIYVFADPSSVSDRGEAVAGQF